MIELNINSGVITDLFQ